MKKSLRTYVSAYFTYELGEAIGCETGGECARVTTDGIVRTERACPI
jgi:hypothetical protein